MSTAALIREGRKRLKLTEQQFADAIGVSRGAVQQWERGTTAPKREHQIAIARKLGISVMELLGLGDIPIQAIPVRRGLDGLNLTTKPTNVANEPAANYSNRSPADEAAALVRSMSPAGQVEAIAYLRFMAERHGTTPRR